MTTTPRCTRGHYSIPRIAPLYPWSLPYIAECWARRRQVPFFESLVSLKLRLNPGLLDHWRTLYSLGQSLPTVIDGNLKAAFSIATTPRCRGGRYSIPLISPLDASLFNTQYHKVYIYIYMCVCVCTQFYVSLKLVLLFYICLDNLNAVEVGY